MNEFTAKKLGEVLAFANLGKELFEKGRQALGTVFTEGGVNEILNSFSKQSVEIEDLAKRLGVSEITIPKSQKTGDKLRKMMELYVGEEWDNPVELLEWMGFFQGAAVIHWNLVEGAANALDHAELKTMVQNAIKVFQVLYMKSSEKIKEAAAKKALA